ncbi:hypothetical protein OIE66_06820 [Nonomuraea sp. NBC_01738]|nr:hypothetical protein OIE66_06820 [Nonomuraea sp. NBC_01738]
MHPTLWTRQPLLVRDGIALAAMGLVRLGIAMGWWPEEWSEVLPTPRSP